MYIGSRLFEEVKGKKRDSLINSIIQLEHFYGKNRDLYDCYKYPSTAKRKIVWDWYGHLADYFDEKTMIVTGSCQQVTLQGRLIKVDDITGEVREYIYKITKAHNLITEL